MIQGSWGKHQSGGGFSVSAGALAAIGAVLILGYALMQVIQIIMIIVAVVVSVGSVAGLLYAAARWRMAIHHNTLRNDYEALQPRGHYPELPSGRRVEITIKK